MKNQNKTLIVVAVGLVGALVMVTGVVGVGFVGYKLLQRAKHSTPSNSVAASSANSHNYDASTSATTADPYSTAPYSPAPYTTTPPPTTYGGIAYSGSRAYQTETGFTDGNLAKTAGVDACNRSIWNAGWPSDSYCGWVPVQTGSCGSVATASAASGWGPTGTSWSASTREIARQAAIEKCNSVGQGACYELITLCM